MKSLLIKVIYIFLSFQLLGFQACNLIKIKEDDQDGRKPIARAFNNFLYREDIKGLFQEGTSEDDSIILAEKYIKEWARKQILIEEASGKINFDEAEIERKVLDYRFSLMGYQFQRSYVQQNLDRNVTEEEIRQYYNDNIDNFVLTENIIRGKYLKIPVEAPNSSKLKKLIRSNKTDDLEELKTYCLSFASAYQLDDSVWMVFEDLVKNTPLDDIPNKIKFLGSRKHIEDSDDDFLYYIEVAEYRIRDNNSPLEFVRDQIKNIILNKRKVELAKNLEDNVYQKAIEKKEFEIFY